MKTIWKFMLLNVPAQAIQMPENALVLSAQLQNGMINIWAEVDESAPMEERKFAIFGTGWPMPSDVKLGFIATIQIQNLVWHVFEILPPP